MTKSNRIDAMFRNSNHQGNPVLGLFLTVGYPDIESSTELSKAVLEVGGDFLELGVPFSDPLAEGSTIQKTSYDALQQGVTVSQCLDVVRTLRSRDVEKPLIFMGYYNPYLRYGLSRFVREAAEAGVDGLIVPDLPYEESGLLSEICKTHGVYLVPLLAPTSTDDRIAVVCEKAQGFIYCVSVTGVTGARAKLNNEIKDLVARIRECTSLPVMVGFGISTPKQVEDISHFATGSVVGSALLDVISKASKRSAIEAACQFVASLRSSSQ